MPLDPRFCVTPRPPYYAVIFSALRTDVDNGYAQAGERIFALASTQPGFLGIETLPGAEGFELSVLYWTDAAAIRAWKENADHLAVQERGRREWYAHYEIRVAKVERAYDGPGEGLHSAVWEGP